MIASIKYQVSDIRYQVSVSGIRYRSVQGSINVSDVRVTMIGAEV